MKGLYFRKNTPDDELIAGLWLIKRDASITSLDVDASFLTFDSFAALFDALSMRRPGLSEVRLRGVPGDQVMVRAIARALNVKKLVLIGKTTQERLFEYAEISFVEELVLDRDFHSHWEPIDAGFAKVIMTAKSLRRLYLKGMVFQDIPDISTFSVIECFCQNDSLEELTVEICYFNYHATQSFWNTIKTKPNLKTLNIGREVKFIGSYDSHTSWLTKNGLRNGMFAFDNIYIQNASGDAGLEHIAARNRSAWKELWTWLCICKYAPPKGVCRDVGVLIAEYIHPGQRGLWTPSFKAT